MDFGHIAVFLGHHHFELSEALAVGLGQVFAFGIEHLFFLVHRPQPSVALDDRIHDRKRVKSVLVLAQDTDFVG